MRGEDSCREQEQTPPTINNANIAAVVLCGGKSRRMGRDKAMLPIGNDTFIQFVVRRLSSVCEPIVVVGAANQQFALPDCSQWLIDQQSDQGPLQGILTGLRWLQTRCEFAFVTSCDAPLIEPQIAGWFAEQIDTHDAIMFADETRSYGLCSLMRVAVAEQIEKMLAAGQRRVQELPNHLNVKRLPVRRLAEVDPPQLSLLNVNTPADLERIAHISRFM